MKFLPGVETLKEAMDTAPWAAALVRVEGGYMAFSSVDEYKIWRNQK